MDRSEGSSYNNRQEKRLPVPDRHYTGKFAEPPSTSAARYKESYCADIATERSIGPKYRDSLEEFVGNLNHEASERAAVENEKPTFSSSWPHKKFVDF